MEHSLKNRILNYLRNTAGAPANPELENERKELIAKMESEVRYVDTNTHTVCTEDLDSIDSDMLRRKLGKKDGEPYTIEDCEIVSEALGEYICDGFGEELAGAIEYRL